MRTTRDVATRAPERHCPLCGSRHGTLLLSRRDVPVLSNRLYPTRDSARAAPTGRLHIVTCSTCGFSFNACFDPNLVVYDADYENDQARSTCFSRHLDDIRCRLLRRVEGRRSQILEIGCGQGRFLEAIVAQGAGRIEAAGYDAAWRRRILPKGLRIEAANFSAAAAGGDAAFDLVLARHVIEHVAEPVAFLRAMAAALGPSGRICIETPDLEWSLATGQMQDFHYEHCNYFTAASLTEAFRQAGLAATSVETVFGGQYLWAEAHLAAAPPRPDRNAADAEPDTGFFTRWQWGLTAMAGPVAVWGAGAKGVTFAAAADPAAELLTCLIDVNPNKQGKFVPRTGHPVVAPEVAARLGIATILVMNPNYCDEIAQHAGTAGLRAELRPC